MNKDEILKRSQQEHIDEMNVYIDNKAVEISIIFMVITGVILLIIGFISSYTSTIIYTTLSLLLSFFAIYSFIKYNYMKKNIYLTAGLILSIASLYSIAEIWKIMW